MGRAHEVRAKKMAQTNAAKSALYNRASKEIYMAAKSGDPDPSSNLALRSAIEKYRGEGVTRDVIDRAIAKAKGGDATTYVGGRYEGYAPAGVAIIVDTLSDNDKRAYASVRAIFSHRGGNLGDSGCVDYLFTQTGVFDFEGEEDKSEEIEMGLLDAGIEGLRGVSFEDGIIEVQVEPKDFAKTRDALKDLGVVDFVTNEITMLPIPDYVKHDVADADKQKLANFVHALDELEDVQNIYTNADFDPLAILQKRSSLRSKHLKIDSFLIRQPSLAGDGFLLSLLCSIKNIPKYKTSQLKYIC